MSADLEVPGQGAAGVSERVAWRIVGSYGELARALAVVKGHDRRAYRQLVADGAAGVWPLERAAAIRGCDAVNALMPSPIVLSGDVLVAWKDRGRRADMIRGPRRDQTIRELAAAGVSIAELAGRAGLSARQVRRIAYDGT